MGKIKNNLNLAGVKKLVLKPVGKAKTLIKRLEIKKAAGEAQLHYANLIQSIIASGRSKLNFAAYVVFDSTYGMDGVFQMMLERQDKWEPKIVVIPDISRGKDHARETYLKTRNFFINKYGEQYVMDGWDPEKDVYYDHLDNFDVVYYANPYDFMVHEYHGIQYASKRNVLPIYVSYGYDVGRLTTLGRLKGIELNLVWKLFADTTYTYQDYKKHQIIKGKNVILAGYSKMDALYAMHSESETKRKTILISSHHTVSLKALPLSNFLKYSDLILDLPLKFPDLDFVFRPHPLLFRTLMNEGLWSEEKVEDYLAKLKERGVFYSSGGDYLSLFKKCDAIINDCGSFTIEWLYTGKPGCFMYNSQLKKSHLTTLMYQAIQRYDVARSEKDVMDFVSKISADDQTKKEYEVDSWVRENIAINYPKVSEILLKEIDILRKK